MNLHRRDPIQVYTTAISRIIVKGNPKKIIVMQKTNKAIIPEEIRKIFPRIQNSYKYLYLKYWEDIYTLQFGNESDTHTCTHTHTLKYSLLTQRQNPKKVSKKLNINIITYMG